MKSKRASGDLERVRATIAAEIIRTLDRRNISPQEAHRLTGSPRPDFSRLRNGRLERFTLDRMIKILGILDEDIEIILAFRVRPK
jgi:predicted XRE-type DNA-binding protein